MPGQSTTDLLAQIRKGNTARARANTALQGIVRQVQALKSDPAAITTWGTEMTGGRINQYCDAIEGIAGASAQTSGAGTKAGG
jgi:hypothetical protein